VVVVAVVVQLAPFAGPLLLSSDAWTYWGYSRLDNPYADVPADEPADPSTRWVGEKWRDTTSVYGPAFTLASEPLAAVRSEDVAAWTFRVLAAAALVACVLVAARAGAFAAAFVGWNPVLALHAAGGGHNDAWVGALLVGALALGAGGRRNLAGVAWALATFVKWVPLVLLPLRALEARAQRRPVGHLAFALTALALVAAATAVYGLAWVNAFGPLARNAADTTSASLANRLTQLAVPESVALGIAAALFVAAYLWLAREAMRGRARLALAAGLLVACSPYVTPWYLAWVVPLAAVDDDRAGRALALGLSAYLLPQTIPL
jgi:alpha-1,6-mannosyltransferase